MAIWRDVGPFYLFFHFLPFAIASMSTCFLAALFLLLLLPLPETEAAAIAVSFGTAVAVALVIDRMVLKVRALRGAVETGGIRGGAVMYLLYLPAGMWGLFFILAAGDMLSKTSFAGKVMLILLQGVATAAFAAGMVYQVYDFKAIGRR